MNLIKARNSAADIYDTWSITLLGELAIKYGSECASARFLMEADAIPSDSDTRIFKINPKDHARAMKHGITMLFGMRLVSR